MFAVFITTGDSGVSTEVIRRVNPDIVCLQEFNRTSSKAEELDSLLSDYDRTVVMEGNRRDPVFPLALYTKYRILGKSHSILGPMKQDGQSVWVDLLVGDDTIRIFNNHLHSTAITVHDDKYLSEHQFLGYRWRSENQEYLPQVPRQQHVAGGTGGHDRSGDRCDSGL